jgi:hypothetical protein
MISRSHVATPARMVSMSLLVGLRVSGCSPPMLRMTSPMPRLVPAYKLFETWEEAIAFASSRRAAQGGPSCKLVWL